MRYVVSVLSLGRARLSRDRLVESRLRLSVGPPWGNPEPAPTAPQGLAGQREGVSQPGGVSVMSSRDSSS